VVRAAWVRLGACVVLLGGLTIAVSDQRFLVGEVGGLQAMNDVPTLLGWPLRIVMQLGTLWVALVVVAGVAWFTREQGPRPALGVLLAVVVAFRLDNVLKDIVDRPRPPGVLPGLRVREHIGGFGFPSGHTTMACALAASLHPLVPKAWRWVPWALAAIVGLARMHVGVHWPADVLGGFALGTAVGTAAWLAVSGLTRERRSPL
jgi:membrane-associated phospholipid phosphatase